MCLYDLLWSSLLQYFVQFCLILLTRVTAWVVFNGVCVCLCIYVYNDWSEIPSSWWTFLSAFSFSSSFSFSWTADYLFKKCEKKNVFFVRVARVELSRWPKNSRLPPLLLAFRTLCPKIVTTSSTLSRFLHQEFWNYFDSWFFFSQETFLLAISGIRT